MTRLLFFMNTSSPFGGVETWLDRAHAFFQDHGFEPVVGLVQGLRHNDPDRYRRAHPDLNAVEVDGRGLDREGRVRALVRCIGRVKPDVAVPMGIVDANEAVARCKQKGQNLRLVAHAQGNLAPMLADLGLYRDWFDRVVCPGKLTRKVLVQWADFPSDRVLHIPNGADPAFSPRQPRRSDGVIRLGFVGRLSQNDKRVLDLIPLCRALSERGVPFELGVVGDGPARKELADGLAAWTDRVHLRGALSPEAIYRDILPALDVLVLTSASEAFGIVLVEAMMHGVVPVSSRYHGFFSEALVQEGRTGLSFPVGEMDAAAAAISRLQQERALLDALSAQALAFAQGYTWQASLSRWVDALRRVAEEPPLRPASSNLALPESAGGRLDRLGMPRGITDTLRRVRRAVLGPAVPAGGEEWPLFHRHHAPAELEEIHRIILELDVPPSENDNEAACQTHCS